MASSITDPGQPVLVRAAEAERAGIDRALPARRQQRHPGCAEQPPGRAGPRRGRRGPAPARQVVRAVLHPRRHARRPGRRRHRRGRAGRPARRAPRPGPRVRRAPGHHGRGTDHHHPGVERFGYFGTWPGGARGGSRGTSCSACRTVSTPISPRAPPGTVPAPRGSRRQSAACLAPPHQAGWEAQGEHFLASTPKRRLVIFLGAEPGRCPRRKLNCVVPGHVLRAAGVIRPGDRGGSWNHWRLGIPGR